VVRKSPPFWANAIGVWIPGRLKRIGFDFKTLYLAPESARAVLPGHYMLVIMQPTIMQPTIVGPTMIMGPRF